MRSYLKTRGFDRHHDYVFAGEDPGERWWEQYAKFTNFERRSLVVASDGTRWRLVLSGLPTTRRDEVNTPISNMLVLEGECGAPDDGDVALVVLLVEAWLADLASGGDRVAGHLDAEFPEHEIPEILAEDDPAVAGLVSDRIRAAIEELGKPADSTPLEEVRVGTPATWFGSRSEVSDRSTLAGAVRALLAGRGRGVAAYLNLLRAQGYAATAAEAILSRGIGSVHLLTDLAPHALPVPKGRPRTRNGTSPWVIAALILAGLGIVALLIWIANRMGRPA